MPNRFLHSSYSLHMKLLTVLIFSNTFFVSSALQSFLSVSQTNYNVSYSVMEETDGPLLLGDLVTDLKLTRLFSYSALEKKNISFLPSNPNYNTHFSVTRIINEDKKVKLELKLKTRLDRESVCPSSMECFFTLQCIVTPFDDLEVFFTVRIFLLDLNDHPPIFLHPTHSVQFSESDVPSTRRPIPFATDKDSGRNARIAYSLVPVSPFFRIDTDSPSQVYLTLIHTLDREKISSFKLNVSAEDFGESKQYGYLELNVEVQDTNDCFPIFDKDTYDIQVVENSFQQNLVKLSAKDADEGENSRIRYLFSVDTPSYIRSYVSIDSEDGTVSLLKPFDREEISKIDFQIRAVDAGTPPKSSLATVHITVLDLNDCRPLINLNSADGRVYVLENREKDTVVTSFTVVDNDLGQNGSVTCRLERADGYDFSIQLYNSQLKLFQILTRYQLDREFKDRFIIEINCTDGGGLSSTKLLNIMVDDENDNFPLFSPDRHYVTITENNPVGLRLLKLNATDLDINNNGLVNFAVPLDRELPESGWFQVDKRSGVVNVTRSLDREERASLTVHVVAHDNGLPYRYSSTATIYVTVEDVNDVPPRLPPVVNFFIEENAPAGVKVGPIAFTDPDMGDGGFVTFFGGDSDGFAIDELGYVISLKEFDRELRPIYSFYAFAKDHGRPSLTSSAQVNVKILDRNDCKPKFIFPFSGTNMSISVHELTGYLVLQAVAKDSDEGENAIVRYFLNPQSPIFSIDSTTGKLTTKKTLDKTRDLGEHKLNIDAHDSGIPTLISSVSLQIVVEDKPSKEALHMSGGANTAIVVMLSALTALLFILVVAVLVIVLLRRRADMARTDYKFIRRRNVSKTDIASPPLVVPSEDFKTEDNVYCSNPYSC